MNAIERSTERLGADLKRIIRDSEELLEATGDVAGEKACQLRSRLRDTLDAANRSCRALEEKTRAQAREVDKLVHQHPYQSVGIAAGLGFVIGLLLTRKA